MQTRRPVPLPIVCSIADAPRGKLVAGAPGYRNKVGIAIGYIEYQYPGTRVAGAGAAAGPAGGPGHGPGELPDTLCQQQALSLSEIAGYVFFF